MAGKNRFLVRGRFIDPGALLDPERANEISLSKVLPSQERLAELEKLGKIAAGGVMAGSREIVMLVDVDSNDELSTLISTLPFWGLLQWSVQPLQTFSSRVSLSRNLYGQTDEG